MKVRTKIWINDDHDKVIFGGGRVHMLETIDRLGSMNKAAKELKMSYKTVWSKIKSTEKNFGRPVVLADKQTGTALTQDGRRLLEKYKRLKARCISADDRIFDEIFSSQKE